MAELTHDQRRLLGRYVRFTDELTLDEKILLGLVEANRNADPHYVELFHTAPPEKEGGSSTLYMFCSVCGDPISYRRKGHDLVFDHV
jgi:hypothetical protein